MHVGAPARACVCVRAYVCECARVCTSVHSKEGWGYRQGATRHALHNNTTGTTEGAMVLV